MIETKRWQSVIPLLINLVSGGLIFAGLYWVSLNNFLLFHTLAELFAILIALSIYVLAWNAREFLDNQAILFLSIAYLFVGVLDLAHTVTFRGMYLFPTAEPSLGTDLWLAARFMQGFAILLAPFFFQKRFQPRVMMFVFVALTLGMATVIFRWDDFPATTQIGGGLTPFKIYSEYFIAMLLLAGLLIWLWKSSALDPQVRRLFIFSIGLTILSELMFTRYEVVTDTPVVFGHLLKIVAFYLVYKAVIQTGLKKPYQLLFRNLQVSRDDVSKERDFVSAILNTANALVLVLDFNGRLVRFNHAFEQASGLKSEEASGLFLWEVGVFSGNADQLRQSFEGHRGESKLLNGESRLLTRSGEPREVAWSSATFNDRGQQYIISTGIDITDRKQVENELIYISTHDILTGLYNRAFFESEMLRLAGTDHFPTSVVMMDMDGLKAVNDTYGHQMGDQMIQKTAQLIKTAFRDEDVIARMGGDEFAVILPGADEANADQARRRVRATLKAYNQKNPSMMINLSFGASTAVAGYMLMETLKKADNAMYKDKLSHHNNRRVSDVRSGID